MVVRTRSLCGQVPEGDTVRLTYTADTAGYLAAGDHLPVSPALPEIAPVPLPAMVEDTVEVAAARAAFQQEFAAVEARNAELMVEAAEPVVEGRRREAVVVPGAPLYPTLQYSAIPYYAASTAHYLPYYHPVLSYPTLRLAPPAGILPTAQQQGEDEPAALNL